MWESLDQRRFPRINIPCDIEIRDPKNAFHYSTVTQNIGAGGVCVILPKELPRSTLVYIKLYVPGRDVPVECSGKVCWRVESKIMPRQLSQFDTGLEFLDIQAHDREYVRDLVDNRIKEKI